MQDYENLIPPAPGRTPWNKGKLIGAKPPLLPKHVWSIRTKLQIAGRTRDLAMFNLAIDSMRRLRIFGQWDKLKANRSKRGVKVGIKRKQHSAEFKARVAMAAL